MGEVWSVGQVRQHGSRPLSHNRDSQRPPPNALVTLPALCHSLPPDRQRGQACARCGKQGGGRSVPQSNEDLFQLLPAGTNRGHPDPRSSARLAAQPAPRLDINRLEENVSLFLGQALAPATLRSYRSGQTRYLRFCHEAGLQSLPLTEQVLCMFVAHLSLTYQTLKCYLSAIRHYSIMAGQSDPFGFPILQYVLRGVRRNPKPAQPRLPITPQILRQLKNQWAPLAGETDYKMQWAACCVGFFGFMRAGGVYYDARRAPHTPGRGS